LFAGGQREKSLDFQAAEFHKIISETEKSGTRMRFIQGGRVTFEAEKSLILLYFTSLLEFMGVSFFQCKFKFFFNEL
jgi:hypothetical protein